MARKKNHAKAPVPPANRPQAGPLSAGGSGQQNRPTATEKDQGAAAQQQDPKRRFGNFSGAGEHAYQQPGGLNDANR